MSHRLALANTAEGGSGICYHFVLHATGTLISQGHTQEWSSMLSLHLGVVRAAQVIVRVTVQCLDPVHVDQCSHEHPLRQSHCAIESILADT